MYPTKLRDRTHAMCDSVNITHVQAFNIIYYNIVHIIITSIYSPNLLYKVLYNN